jgi:hypothetical protein
MLRLRPLLVTRFANAFGGLVIPFIPFVVLLQEWNPDDSTASAIAIPVGLVSLVLAVRGFRLGVMCGPVTVTVRGYWRSRTIPIADVLDLHEPLLLSIRWRDRRGRRRKTPVLAFSTPRKTFPFVAQHAESSVEQLQHWINRHQRPAKART